MKIRKTIDNKLSSLFSKIENKLSVEVKLAIGLAAAVGLIVGINSLNKPNDVSASSVMITNITGNSGGTGIVLDSSETNSVILTNSHVCKVVENGGLATGHAGTFLIASYKHSKTHDLCMITVDGNLDAHTKIASKAPKAYYENAIISGHPALMPNVVTGGHFSGRKVIAVMKGLTACTDDQKRDPATMLLCLLVGGIPQIEQYDSTLVTATIMPGSSGSGVYNENKELAGVAFAGSGEGIGYAWTVPYESMKNFLDKEAKTLEAKRPNNIVDISNQSGSKKKVSESEMMKNLKEACSSSNKNKIKNICELAGQDMVWFK